MSASLIFSIVAIGVGLCLAIYMNGRDLNPPNRAPNYPPHGNNNEVSRRRRRSGDSIGKPFNNGFDGQRRGGTGDICLLKIDNTVNTVNIYH